VGEGEREEGIAGEREGERDSERKRMLASNDLLQRAPLFREKNLVRAHTHTPVRT